MNQPTQAEPIAALATPVGVGAIAVVRVSGQGAIERTSRIFLGKDLTAQPSHTAHVGSVRQADGALIDEVMVTVFRAPKSFTKEDAVEISCHGSDYIVRQLLARLGAEGVRLAQPGEFTRRAFLNGRFDLVQAEAVADLIAADSAAGHRAALTQLRGGFSRQLSTLRQQLIDFVALVELELDFGEEDVAFANRPQLRHLMTGIRAVLQPLIASFAAGNVVRNGVATVIAGKPNAGKSTLLNALLNDDKAIVSDIPGTTRDVIEDMLFVNGIRFRLIDTAGLRQATDTIEAIGIERTNQQIDRAALVLYLFDAAEMTPDQVRAVADDLTRRGIACRLVVNKIDKLSPDALADWQRQFGPALVPIQANTGRGLDALLTALTQFVHQGGAGPDATLMTNARHQQHLQATDEALTRAIAGLDAGISADWLALDLRVALRELGAITGEIVTDDLLDSIFSKFCIGK
jgi:tRNA modification GTPase